MLYQATRHYQNGEQIYSEGKVYQDTEILALGINTSDFFVPMLEATAAALGLVVVTQDTI